MVFRDRRKKENERRRQSRRASAAETSFIDRRRDDRRDNERRRTLPELQESVWAQGAQLHSIKRALMRRVVITGIGTVAPTGIGVENFWDGMKKGINCIDHITHFDASKHPAKIAAEIRDFSPVPYIKKHEISGLSRSAQFAIVAAHCALSDASLTISRKLSPRTGVVLGTGVSGMEFVESELLNYFNAGMNMRKVNPFVTIGGFAGAVSSELSIRLKLNGPSLTLATGCTGSHDAMGYALSLIRGGTSDVILTGGTDACITPAIVTAFCRINALATNWNDRPKSASRPFNKDRDGFVIGEGAAVLVLEELSHAVGRGARIYAEVLGYGSSCDAYHMTQPIPGGAGSANAMTNALNDANLAADAVDYINAHGTSTPLNDKAETKAIKKVFGARANTIPVSSIKSMIGHAVGAAGSFGISASALAIKNSFVPPTINYENPDPECDLDYVPNKGRHVSVNYTLCNSIGFGAKNSVIVLGHNVLS